MWASDARNLLARITHAALGALAAVIALLAATGHAHAGTTYALIIANKTYRHTGEVRFADRDAAAIESVLVDTKGVQPQNIFRYENASVGDLTFLFGTPGQPGRIAQLVSGSDSELIVYFAGHGSKHLDKARGKSVPYLLGVDSRPEALPQTAYALDTVVEKLKTIQRDTLTNGRVTLILESCFSGRSNDGDLIKNRSAPAFGPAVTLSKQTAARSERFVMMAAAQGEQFAIWDNDWKRSVFTDALVSGLYGEADATRFSGNGDGAVTLGELRQFVTNRIARRLRKVNPSERQDPDIFGGRDELALVSVGENLSEWPEIVRRQHTEKLQSAILKASANPEKIKDFLSACLYCPDAETLREKLRTEGRRSTVCKLERSMADSLIAAKDTEGLASLLAVAQCARNKPELNRQLAALRTPADANVPPQPKAEDKTPAAQEEPKPSQTTALQPEQGSATDDSSASSGNRQMRQQRLPDEDPVDLGDPPVPPYPNGGVRRRTASMQQRPTRSAVDAVDTMTTSQITWGLQRELARTGCLRGRVDGVWGRGSVAALRRFGRVTGQRLRTTAPTARMLRLALQTIDNACKKSAGGQSWRKPQG
ncbi:MAG: caspase family protein [Pseudomonadota bacterium]